MFRKKNVCDETTQRDGTFVVSVFAIINITRMFVLTFPNFGPRPLANRDIEEKHKIYRE